MGPFIIQAFISAFITNVVQFINVIFIIKVIFVALVYSVTTTSMK